MDLQLQGNYQNILMFILQWSVQKSIGYYAVELCVFKMLVVVTDRLKIVFPSLVLPQKYGYSKREYLYKVTTW